MRHLQSQVTESVAFVLTSDNELELAEFDDLNVYLCTGSAEQGAFY